jgi:hypothetical protein
MSQRAGIGCESSSKRSSSRRTDWRRSRDPAELILRVSIYGRQAGAEPGQPMLAYPRSSDLCNLHPRERNPVPFELRAFRASRHGDAVLKRTTRSLRIAGPDCEGTYRRTAPYDFSKVTDLATLGTAPIADPNVEFKVQMKRRAKPRGQWVRRWAHVARSKAFTGRLPRT